LGNDDRVMTTSKKSFGFDFFILLEDHYLSVSDCPHHPSLVVWILARRNRTRDVEWALIAYR
jgi:hypothetical protein